MCAVSRLKSGCAVMAIVLSNHEVGKKPSQLTLLRPQNHSLELVQFNLTLGLCGKCSALSWVLVV